MSNIEQEIGNLYSSEYGYLQKEQIDIFSAYVCRKLVELGEEIKCNGRLVELKIADDFYTIAPEEIDAAVQRMTFVERDL